MLELSKIAMTNTSLMEVINPLTGEKSGAFIELYGMHTHKFENAVKSLGRMIKSEDMEDDIFTIELLTRCTKSIKGFMDNGVELEINEENIREIYKLSPHIRNQADSFMAQKHNFFLNS